ncbi:MAG TPA: hypothetical protein PKM95_08240, partial [Deltaproteobacteria bacterium]|nr:hypothetical protein [Deltaproteobacteria bacterium]
VFFQPEFFSVSHSYTPIELSLERMGCAGTAAGQEAFPSPAVHACISQGNHKRHTNVTLQQFSASGWNRYDAVGEHNYNINIIW